MADPIDNITEEAELNAELQRLKDGQIQPPEPPEGIDTGLPPVQEEPKPVIEVKPESEEPKPEEKPVEAKPAETKPARTAEEEMREGTLRRLLREQKRRTDELERQLLERQTQQQTPEKPKEPTYEDDPGEYLRRQNQQLEQRLTQIQQQQLQNAEVERVARQEQEYQLAKPDYPDARKYLEESESKEWEISGLAVSQVNQLRDAARLARAGNQQFKPYLDHLENVARREDVQALADRENREPEDVAAWLVARDTYVQSRRNQVWEGAKAAGKSVAEVAYEMARSRGYQVKAAEAPKQETGEAARQRVLQAKEISAAASSLSESSAEGGGTGPKVIRNRQQVLNLNDDELDALINSNRYREL